MPNNNSGLPEGTATSRSECRCPDCLSYKGLEEIPEANKLYDDPVDKIIHASKCANDSCSTGKIKAKKIRKQIDESALEKSEPLINLEDFSIGDYIFLPSDIVRSTSWKIIGVVLLFVLSATFGTLGGFGGGDGVAAASNSYDGIEIAGNTTLETVYEDGNWTVYRSGDSYIVSGTISGSVVFLTENGEVTDSPYRLDNLTAAKEAITLWQVRNDQSPSKYPMPNATQSLTSQIGWQVFSYNGSYLVSGKINDQIVFLQPNGEYTQQPYFYDNRSVAEESILYWAALAQTNDLPPVELITKAELQKYLSDWDPDKKKFDIWNSTDLGNWSIYTNGSAYVATASVNNETVFLQPNATISSSVAYFNSSTAVLQALSSWRDNNPEIAPKPISSSPDLGTGWEPINNQDTITNDLTSEKLTTISNGPISSDTGTIIAGTVKDTNDNPVSNATVILHSTPQTTTTDSNGEFIFTGVSKGDHTIHVAPPDGSGLAAPRNTSIQVNKNGEITVQNNPDNVLYFENKDGTISQNRLTFLAQEKQPIVVSGSGSDISATIQVANPSNINPLDVTFHPKYTASQKSTSFNGSDLTETLKINGSAHPEDQSIQLLGEIASEQQTVRGTYTGGPGQTFNPVGNLNVSDATATITPRAYSENKTWTGTTSGSSLSIDPNSIRDPNTGELTIKPEIQHSEKTNEGYYSGGEIRIYNPGNTETTAEIDITGKRGWTTVQHIGSGAHVYLSDWNAEHGVDYREESHRYTATLDHTGTYRVDWSVSVHWDGGNADAYALIDGPGIAKSVMDEWAVHEDWKSASGSFTRHISSGDEVRVYVRASVERSGNDADASAHYTIKKKESTGTVTLSHAGQAVSTQHLSEYETDTVEMTLEPGWNYISTDISGYNDISVNADFTAKSYPEDVSASISGTQLFSHSGPLKNPQTIDIPDSAIGTDETSLDLQTGVGQFDYELNITARNTTMDPTLAVGNHTVFSHSGPLMQSQTVDLPANDLTLGTNELDFSSSAGSLNYTVNYSARAVPENVSIQIGTKTYTYPDDFPGSGPLPYPPYGEPTQINISALSIGEQTVSVSTNPVDGINTSVDATLVYDGRTKQTFQPAVIVEAPDGTRHTKEIPNTALKNGQLLSTYNMTIPANWLGTGENEIIVRTADDSVVSAKITTAGLKYQNKSLDYGS